MNQVHLEISEHGYPIVYFADFYYRCLPGLATSSVKSCCLFSSRAEAVRWCKYQLRAEIDWALWKSGTSDYPFLKNYDGDADECKNLNPTFVATFERAYDEGSILKTVSVKKMEVRKDFDWASEKHPTLEQIGKTSSQGSTPHQHLKLPEVNHYGGRL